METLSDNNSVLNEDFGEECFGEDDEYYCQCREYLKGVKGFGNKIKVLSELMKDKKFNFLKWGIQPLDDNTFIAAPKILAPLLGYERSTLNNYIRRSGVFVLSQMRVDDSIREGLNCVEAFKKTRCWHLYTIIGDFKF